MNINFFALLLALYAIPTGNQVKTKHTRPKKQQPKILTKAEAKKLAAQDQKLSKAAAFYGTKSEKWKMGMAGGVLMASMGMGLALGG